ncbi:MAG TPA: ABC transporter permease, partial [Solirubrobacteraceae bacterium]|nr:ABC transporter permease [Solirubrobacteraceae bacterium]
MSASAAAPAALAPRTSARRPSTFAIWRWELRKLAAQKRTYLGFAIALVVPVFFVIAEHFNQHHGHGGDSIFFSEITQSGLVTPVLSLILASTFFLPLSTALVCGDIVANEDGNGTLKTILTRSVDRGLVFAAKVLAAFAYAAAAVFLAAFVATVAGVASWGFNDIVSLSGTVVPP